MSDVLSSLNRTDVLAKLKTFLVQRGHAYGLLAIGCFGSVARSEATSESDVDIVYQTNSSTCITLFDLVLLRDELMDLLGRPVDLIEFRENMPAKLRDRLEKEAIYA